MQSRMTWSAGPVLGLALVLGSAATAPGAGGSELDQVDEPVRRCTRETPENCVNGASASVTSLDALRVTGQERTQREREGDGEEDSVEARLRPFVAHRGAAAGEGFLAHWGLWASYSHSDFSFNLKIPPSTEEAYDADLDSVLIGMDTMPIDRLLVGLSLGYASLDVETRFNGGSQDIDGFSIAPYVAYLINDILSADLTVGYTRLQTDQNRIDPANAATLVSDFGADRFFATANLNAVYAWNDVVLGGRVGYLYTAESQDAYRETGGPSIRNVRSTHLDLAQGYVGVDIGYAFGDFEPYAIGIYRNDFGRDTGGDNGGLPGAIGTTQPDDDDEVQYGGGLRYFGPGGITARFEYLNTVGRSLFDDDTFSLLVRMDF